MSASYLLRRYVLAQAGPFSNANEQCLMWVGIFWGNRWGTQLFKNSGFYVSFKAKLNRPVFCQMVPDNSPCACCASVALQARVHSYVPLLLPAQHLHAVECVEVRMRDISSCLCTSFVYCVCTFSNTQQLSKIRLDRTRTTMPNLSRAVCCGACAVVSPSCACCGITAQ
jgi:hypothetical protein